MCEKYVWKIVFIKGLVIKYSNDKGVDCRIGRVCF